LIIEETELRASPEELFAFLRDRPGSFLLDSAQSSGGLGTHSYIGFDPFLEFRASGTAITITQGSATETLSGDPLDALRPLLARHRCPPGSPLPFSGGAVGYVSYELCALLDRIPRARSGGLSIPDVALDFHDGVLAHDLRTGRWSIVANPVAGRSADEILGRMRAIIAAFRAAPPPAGLPRRIPAPGTEPTSNFSKAEYLQCIGRIKDYIRSGDVYQVNLSQRFEAPLACHPYALYRRLRSLSPAPFACYLNHGDLQVAGSSPERFLRIRERRIETRPIKGTRPRGATPAEDARLAAELMASEKDRAELLMIVDLERNDLGRVCDYGTVAVDEIFRLETHPTVHHLVASVSGKIRPNFDVLDCIRALFPGGSITGAPKIRAMQIIDEIETRRRDLYTGAIGYLGFDGNCDLNIAIRTISCAGGRAYYHAGGGIVWDSDPEAEYQETLDKARAMRQALAEAC